MAISQIMIVDDYELARRGLKNMLESEPDLLILGEFSSVEELLQDPKLSETDVVLMDIKLPGMDGIQAIPYVKDVNPKIKVLVVSSCADEKVGLVLQAGGDGCLTKGARQVELIAAIRATIQGVIPLDPSISRQIWGQGDDHNSAPTRRVMGNLHLSERQSQILDLVKEGTPNSQIASALNISEQTVKNHMTHIFDGLEVQDRTEAVVKALRHGFISLWHRSPVEQTS